jgi:hypothetical protein
LVKPQQDVWGEASLICYLTNKLSHGPHSWRRKGLVPHFKYRAWEAGHEKREPFAFDSTISEPAAEIEERGVTRCFNFLLYIFKKKQFELQKKQVFYVVLAKCF